VSASKVSLYSFEQLKSPVHAHRGANDVLSAAWAEADQIRAQAREEGEAAGRAAGFAAAQAEAAAAVAAVRDAGRALAALRGELVATLETQAAELATGLAEQILTAALELQPERVVDVTRSALRRLTDRHRVTVIVNPTDLELLSSEIAALTRELGGIEHLEVQSDRRIGRGGAIIRTDYGEVDATIATQLQSARQLVAAALTPPPDATVDATAAEPTDAD
jgi:flagellar assembly protein FliH